MLMVKKEITYKTENANTIQWAFIESSLHYKRAVVLELF